MRAAVAVSITDPHLGSKTIAQVGWCMRLAVLICSQSWPLQWLEVGHACSGQGRCHGMLPGGIMRRRLALYLVRAGSL